MTRNNRRHGAPILLPFVIALALGPGAEAQEPVFRDCVDCPPMVGFPDQGFAAGQFEVSVAEFGQFVADSGYEITDRCWTFNETRLETDASAEILPLDTDLAPPDDGVLFDDVEDGEILTGLSLEMLDELENAPGDPAPAAVAPPARETPPARSWQKPGFHQDGDHPVSCVSWHDAQAYVSWLAQSTGQPYRLLSGAEWEFLAQTHTGWPELYTSQPAPACRQANLRDRASTEIIAEWQVAQCHDGFAGTAPRGSFPASTAGLHDLIGNVAEWVADCDPPAGNTPSVDGCSQRGLRGGSWATPARGLPARAFSAATPEVSFTTRGIRVGRDLEAKSD